MRKFLLDYFLNEGLLAGDLYSSNDQARCTACFVCSVLKHERIHVRTRLFSGVCGVQQSLSLQILAFRLLIEGSQNFVQPGFGFLSALVTLQSLLPTSECHASSAAQVAQDFKVTNL